MPLHPQAQAVLELMSESGLTIGESTKAAELRQAIEAFAAAGRPPAEPVHDVTDRTIPTPDGDITVRVYRPGPAAALPVLVFFHGGGWVIGSLETHDATARALANRAGCVVVSVNYRLAPEHRFPAAVDDAYATTDWIAEHADELGVDAARVAVGGDSAGGNLTAVVSQLARDLGRPALVFQLMIYPATDYEFDSVSMVENATGYFLERDSMRWFYRQYLSDDADGADARVSPLRARDLSALPPAMIVTAEFDPLRDQGEAYAKRLADAGVEVDLRRYDGVFHGFFGMQAILETADQAIDDVTAVLRGAFGSGAR
jgi:acetyl esterase